MRVVVGKYIEMDFSLAMGWKQKELIIGFFSLCGKMCMRRDAAHIHTKKLERSSVASQFIYLSRNGT